MGRERLLELHKSLESTELTFRVDGNDDVSVSVTVSVNVNMDVDVHVDVHVAGVGYVGVDFCWKCSQVWLPGICRAFECLFRPSWQRMRCALPAPVAPERDSSAHLKVLHESMRYPGTEPSQTQRLSVGHNWVHFPWNWQRLWNASDCNCNYSLANGAHQT